MIPKIQALLGLSSLALLRCVSAFAGSSGKLSLDSSTKKRGVLFGKKPRGIFVESSTQATALSAYALSPAGIDNLDGWMPLYLSAVAGASTCLGAAIVFCHPKTDNHERIVSDDTMSFALALAGSCMVTIVIVAIGPECLRDGSGTALMPLWSTGFLFRTIAFGLGCLLYFALSLFAFPEPDEILGHGDIDDNFFAQTGDSVLETMKMCNETGSSFQRQNGSFTKTLRNHMRSSSNVEYEWDSGDDVEAGYFYEKEGLLAVRAKYPPKNSKAHRQNAVSIRTWSSGEDLDTPDQKRAWRVAMILFVSLLLHNFPEGLAVAASALESAKLGLAVTVGIMIHNIPEGIAIAVPCLAARPNQPWLSFLMASFSGLAEPFGAFISLVFLRNFAMAEGASTNAFLCMENVLAFVAGIMISVAMYELFPEAKRYTTNGMDYFHAGIASGIIVMVFTELYLP